MVLQELSRGIFALFDVKDDSVNESKKTLSMKKHTKRLSLRVQSHSITLQGDSKFSFKIQTEVLALILEFHFRTLKVSFRFSLFLLLYNNINILYTVV